MADDISKNACPYCGQVFEKFSILEEFNPRATLQEHLESAHSSKVPSWPVWGREVYAPPEGEAFIEVDDMKCSGCGLCAEACSMQHFGVINKNFARIFVRKVLTPMPKAVVSTCTQCQKEERLCEQACPVTPSAITFDEKTWHMVINKDTCTGCLQCQEACGTEAIHFNEDVGNTPFVCDLCDTNNSGERNPQCVKICPQNALYFHNRADRGRSTRDNFRKSTDQKAMFISRRLYPLTKDSIAFPPWHPEDGLKRGGK
jgi:Fe-S-cluster-containing hydrogenase component 2